MKMKITFTVVLAILMMAGFAWADGRGGNYNNSESGSYSGAGASVDDHSTTKIRSTDRKFPNAGMTPMPGTNPFFAEPTPDSSFRSVRELIEMISGPGAFTFKITEGALKRLAKGGDVESHLQIIRGRDVVKRAGFQKDAKWLWIAYHKPTYTADKITGYLYPKNLIITGAVDGEADDGDTNSFQVLGEMGLKAIRDGNDCMVISKENHHRRIEASGWGIGFYTVIAGNWDDGKGGGAGGGGTGYASNKSGPEDLPWAQGYVGVLIGDYPSIK
jgi:hypothetical protein